MNALNVLRAQLTRDLFAIAKFLYDLNSPKIVSRPGSARTHWGSLHRSQTT